MENREGSRQSEPSMSLYPTLSCGYRTCVVEEPIERHWQLHYSPKNTTGQPVAYNVRNRQLYGE